MYIFLLFLTFSTVAIGQTDIPFLAKNEHQAGRFNGTILAIKDGHMVAETHQGNANMQFEVPITSDTRFPIASISKLFTAVLTLQLVEQAQLQLESPASTYLPDLPVACQDITIKELLTHTSGLKNEPVQAYGKRYSTKEFVQHFVEKDGAPTSTSFNYNNVDYILLTRILEAVTRKSFSALVHSKIFDPLDMQDSGIISESRVILHLAYGYHNYTFGRGSIRDTLRNDRRYLSNYAGAGAVYSTTADLYKFVQGLKTHTLLSVGTTEAYLVKPQQDTFVDFGRGYPTLGFFYNDSVSSTPLLERRGSIGGFNSVLLTNRDFTKLVIILTNTDQADLKLLGDKVYQAF